MAQIRNLKIYKKPTEFWSSERSFSVLLVILLLQIFVVIPGFVAAGFERIILAIFYFILLSGGLIAVVKTNRYFVFILLGLAFLVFVGSELILEGKWIKIAFDWFYAACCATLALIVLIRTFYEGPITIHRIWGAIVVYLLISLVFSMLYHSIFILKGDSSFSGLRSREHDQFIYFSLVSLTTVGYGDIAPVSKIARSLANLEGLIGQLYPAILIARLVSMELISARKERQSNS